MDEDAPVIALEALETLKEQRDTIKRLKDKLFSSPDSFVHCKDCRHCTFSDGEQLADCMIKQGWFPVKPDWFCADGERRT